MKLQTEKDVKQAVKKMLDKFKPRLTYFMPSASIYGKAGVHDFIICIDGSFISIETKAPHIGKKGLTALQRKFGFDVEAAGGHSFVVANEDQLNQMELLLKVY